MSLPYSVRLACMCLAAFFLAQLAGAIAVRAFAPAILQWSRRLQPASAAMLLFTIRVLPAVLAAAVVAFFCIPSYVMFEQDAGAEEAGILCIGCVSLCLVGWVRAAARTSTATARSIRFIRRCRKSGSPVLVAGQSSPIWVTEHCLPGLALAGILSPRFIISVELARALPEEELVAALRHERAHWESKDNLKRLLFLLTPDPLFSLGCFARLEREWAHVTELAADDRAVEGSQTACLTLAAALVRTARMGTRSGVPRLMSTLITSHCDLMERVSRLLDPTTGCRSSRLPRAKMILASSALLAAGLAAIPELSRLHEALEALMH